MDHRDTETTENGDPLSGAVIGAAIEVHRVLGPGLLESAYEQCLARELSLRGLEFKRQVDLPVEYKGLLLEAGYRLDFVIQGRLLIELKAVESVLPVHEAQVITYPRLSSLKTALLINFGAKTIKDGIRRFSL